MDCKYKSQKLVSYKVPTTAPSKQWAFVRERGEPNSFVLFREVRARHGALGMAPKPHDVILPQAEEGVPLKGRCPAQGFQRTCF